MTELQQRVTESPFCSLRAQHDDADPIGYATPFHNYVIMEVPLPWPLSVLQSDARGTAYQRIRDSVVRAFLANGMESMAAGRGNRVLGVAPEPEWSTPGITRLWHVTRGAEQIAEFDIAEYELPSLDLAADFAEAAIHAPSELVSFESYRTNVVPHRSFLVCTHGAEDACCGRFGYPLYQHLKRHYPEIRARRAIHFGGHRFAPTAIELPSGHTWAYLDEETSEQIVRRAGDVHAIARCLRGWCGMTGVAQVADREAFKREGWGWLATRRSGRVLDQDERTGRSHVRIDFTRPDQSAGAYEAVVGIARQLPQLACLPHPGENDARIAEYRLESFHEVGAGT